MKLGHRLQQLDAMVGTGYEHIWDCCCDHGLLGARLLERKAASGTMHFVDIVPRLIESLTSTLRKQAAPDSSWQVHCQNVAELSLEQHHGRQLMIIAGVGGELTAEFVESIVKNNPKRDIDFLLCPVHHLFTLRERLIALNMELLVESLVEENKRFYELLLIRHAHTDDTRLRKISPVGSDVWLCGNDLQAQTAQNYLDKTIAHHQRQKTTNAKRIVEAYKGVTITLLE